MATQVNGKRSRAVRNQEEVNDGSVIEHIRGGTSLQVLTLQTGGSKGIILMPSQDSTISLEVADTQETHPNNTLDGRREMKTISPALTPQTGGPDGTIPMGKCLGVRTYPMSTMDNTWLNVMLDCTRRIKPIHQVPLCQMDGAERINQPEVNKLSLNIQDAQLNIMPDRMKGT